MAFSLDQFYQINRRALIWLILFGLLWLLRDFFSLIFVTYVIAFIAYSVVRALETRGKVPYRASLIVIYVLFLGALLAFVSLVTPNAIRETGRFAGNLGDVQESLVTLKTDFVRRYPALQRPFTGYVRSVLDAEALARVEAELTDEAQRLGIADYYARRLIETPSEAHVNEEALARLHALEEEYLLNSFLAQQGTRVREHIPGLINLLYRTTATLLLALLFSFLILIDLSRLRNQVQGLRSSRLHDFYEEAAQPVIRFAYVVGRALQVQAMIAVVNTVLTTLGLIALGVPSKTMLALVVFVCSFIPVLGVFISTTPIILVGLNAQGLGTAIAIIALVTVVHVVEAYVINPLMYGRHLNLNPVLVLIILFIGYHGFGIWGMVLGLPVALYLLHDVFGVPLWQQRPQPTRASGNVIS